MRSCPSGAAGRRRPRCRAGPARRSRVQRHARPRPDDPWASFGAASLVLPTFGVAQARVGRDADRGDRPGSSRTTRCRLRSRRRGERSPGRRWPVERLVGLEWRPRRPDRDRRAPDRSTNGPIGRTWERTVGLFAGAVGRGRIDKVVLGAPGRPPGGRRSRRRRRASPPGADGAREHDLRVHPGRRRPSSAPRRSDSCAPVGRSFETVAIAGSAPRGGDPDEDARLAAGLLASEKDREEHAVVVDMLRASLAPIVETLHVADAPVDPAAAPPPAPRDADHRHDARRGRAARAGRPAAPDAGRRRHAARRRARPHRRARRRSIAAGMPGRSAGSGPTATAR